MSIVVEVIVKQPITHFAGIGCGSCQVTQIVRVNNPAVTRDSSIQEKNGNLLISRYSTDLPTNAVELTNGKKLNEKSWTLR